jgi:hypothetical protein
MNEQTAGHAGLIAASAPVTATLPVELADGLNLDQQAAHAFGARYLEHYCSAEPFPHIVIDDFLPQALARAICDNFPLQDLPSDVNYEMGYAGLHKRQVLPADCSAYCRNLFAFFNSAAMLQFLEGLTGIGGLIPDPYYNGAGFHEIARGGLLGIHADFRIHEQLHLKRRINVLIYFNPQWDPAWGGKLELWDRAMQGAVRSIAPHFNRCVVFNTDARSFHGHPDPLDCPATVTRKSIALYYYTASERIYEDTPADGTVYRSRPTDGLKTRVEAGKLRAHNYILKDLLPPVVFRGLRSVYRLARSVR